MSRGPLFTSESAKGKGKPVGDERERPTQSAGVIQSQRWNVQISNAYLPSMDVSLCHGELRQCNGKKLRPFRLRRVTPAFGGGGG